MCVKKDMNECDGEIYGDKQRRQIMVANNGGKE